MSEIERSAALKRALAEEADGLPADFAVRVAASAEAASELRRSKWSDAGLIAAFAVMLGVCVAGWFGLVGSAELGGPGLFDLLAGAAASQPWLVIAVAGFAIVQLSTFHRRAKAQRFTGPSPRAARRAC